MKNILKKLHEVMKDVEYIKKDKKNSHQNYNYASEAVIKERFHESFTKHGVIFTLETHNARIEGNLSLLDCRYHFYDVESGEELTGTFIGSGQGRDEKGFYAAVTGAIKYTLTSTFLTATGDDPEDDKNEEPKKPVVAKTLSPKKPSAPVPPSKEQLQEINRLAYAKLNIVADNEIIPAINEKLGLNIGRLTLATDKTVADEVITKLQTL